MIDYLQQNPALFITYIFLLGLLVGSFLNVVIHRLPIMMERQWHRQCTEFLKGEPPPAAEPFNLMVPGSRCPHCGHRIRAWENIPVISYLWLKGKCAGCQAAISPRYPIIELVSACAAVTVAWHFGVSWQTLAALVLTWSLIALTMIDYDHQLLPDDITLPMLWLGLAISLGGLFVDSASSLIGALAGYLSLWSVYIVFKLVTGKEGMGFGDFKLLAMLGAWLGWKMLPVIILLSSLVGALVGIALIVFCGREKTKPIPFGPYLAGAGWIAMLWGDGLLRLYLGKFATMG
ncbi:MAG: methyltransferase [Gammaproteobacteria bacterium RBG_16_57_12]|nr:MAG: methyltransferase [Gammaproteobacteria bacterium RBG_16_57_12]